METDYMIKLLSTFTFFLFDTLWLAANPFFLKGISFFIYAHSFTNTTTVCNKCWVYAETRSITHTSGQTM